MAYIRKLRKSDALLMYEWMHDEEVVHYMKADFRHKTLDDCIKFIVCAQNDSNNVHMAVADDKDTYMGTVSLKNIQEHSAEFAIVMSKSAAGKGYASEGMKQILEFGFNIVGLTHIYWCVDRENHRAVRFYDKNGYQRITLDDLCNKLGFSAHNLEEKGYRPEEAKSYIWYMEQGSAVASETIRK